MCQVALALLLITAAAIGAPVDNRCFNDGILVEDKHMDHGIAEICIKDDISIIKTTSRQISNTSTYANTVSRKMIIQNYEECNPIEVSNGPIMIFKPTKDLLLVPHTYACRVDCTISLDEEEANIVLHSDKLNHFEVMGTTTANKWFQGSTSYSLEHTCEHIQVTCGSNSLGFHACFKYHMACIRLMNRSYMPAFMIQSVCQNKELILVGMLILIIFGILYVMTLTYICYILIPVFYPLTYIYGLIYNKACKKCYYCGLAYHPFTKCGKNCVCGCMFENSDRMKAHRENGMCKGYKSLRAARILCKNRGSSLILACILSFLLLSFIQPLEAIKLQYNNEIIEIDSVTEQFDSILDQLDIAKIMPHTLIVLITISLLILVILAVFRTKMELIIFSKLMYYCAECDMIHSKRRLRFFFNGEFTSKCNSCTCGVDYNNELADNGDYMIVMDHKLTEKCYIPGKYKAVRKLETLTTSITVILLIIMLLVSATYANSDNCLKIADSKKIAEPVECSIWYKMPGTCPEYKNPSELFRDLALPKGENDSLRLSEDVAITLRDSEQSPILFKSYLLEESLIKLHCKGLIGYKTKTGELNKKLAALITTSNLEICAANKDDGACACMKSLTGCTQPGTMTNAVNYYKANTEIFKHDLEKVTSSLIRTYPGLFARELSLSMLNTNLSKAKQIANKMSGKFGNADSAVGCLKFLSVLLADSTLVAINPKIRLPAAIPYIASWKDSNTFDNIQSGSTISECQNAKAKRCHLPISARIEIYLTCNSESNKFYKVPEEGVAPKLGQTQFLCVRDPFCDATFPTVEPADKEKMQSMVCHDAESNAFNHSKTLPINKCRKLSTQTCLYKGQNKTFMECSNGYFYEYTSNVYQSPQDDVGIYCFDKNCKTKVYPHHIANLLNCKAHVINMKSRRLKEIVYENIEQLKHSIQEVIKTDLIEHKYILTKDLPKMAPSFRPLTIQGIESDSGVENAYIETNLLVRAGVSTGVTLKSKDGQVLFDIVLFVKSAHYEAGSEYIYTTGPTVGINMQHDEQCTGSCPSNLKKNGWLSFSKEHTSTWGCEEFGCLAINDGCLFGHCKDIIKPEMKVYRKSGDDTPKVQICVTVPDGGYCHEISSFAPIISEKMEIQFLSNEAGRLPKIFAYKSNKVMTGMINDLGTFSRMCGSVQSIGQDVFGAGIPRYDFICHAAKRKDVTISRCYDNFYESCLNLNTEKDMIFDDKTNKIQMLNKLMGEIRIKLKFGDIRYKTFEKDPSFDLKGSCVGCLDCIKGVDCEITILASTDTVCPVESNCVLYHNNIKIEANTQKYGIKMKCSEETVNLKICTQEITIQPTIVKKQETIEVGNSDQTYYVKEQDIRCNTWLCKVSTQGISAIFSPFLNLFGSYGKIVFYSLLALLLLFIAGFVCLPVFGRIKDMLKSHEIEYLREVTGRKPYTR
ncbi:polyprotein [Resistencia virus]|uniref:Envelopment polyprotein n=1 Tax=Resistencia virus TaxID=2748240 RepID=A0A7D9MVV5_9VIRU|nr:polyprotein [Resistencia virus]